MTSLTKFSAFYPWSLRISIFCHSVRWADFEPSVIGSKSVEVWGSDPTGGLTLRSGGHWSVGGSLVQNQSSASRLFGPGRRGLWWEGWKSKYSCCDINLKQNLRCSEQSYGTNVSKWKRGKWTDVYQLTSAVRCVANANEMRKLVSKTHHTPAPCRRCLYQSKHGDGGSKRIGV